VDRSEFGYSINTKSNKSINLNVVENNGEVVFLMQNVLELQQQKNHNFEKFE
jgi:hypothetical protein